MKKDSALLTALGLHPFSTYSEDGTHTLCIAEQVIDLSVPPQSVAIGAASEASSAVGSTTNRVVLSATVDCWVAVGADPTAVAHTAGSFFLAAGAQSYPLKVTPSTTKIAVIKDSEDGYLSVIESL